LILDISLVLNISPVQIDSAARVPSSVLSTLAFAHCPPEHGDAVP
jgi:hypothetical protein